MLHRKCSEARPRRHKYAPLRDSAALRHQLRCVLNSALPWNRTGGGSNISDGATYGFRPIDRVTGDPTLWVVGSTPMTGVGIGPRTMLKRVGDGSPITMGAGRMTMI